MLELYSQIGIAVLVFVSTNIDDIFLLAAFFADNQLKTRSIVVGQYLGIAILVMASSLVAWMSIALPEGWISLLGLVPLYLGLSQINSLWHEIDDSEEDVEIQNQEHSLQRGLGSQIMAVASVTLANGGDNLGVYIPMFANQFSGIPVYASVFAIMTFVWCCLGYILVNNKIFGHWLRRYGHKILPLVLTLLGLHILSGALVLLH